MSYKSIIRRKQKYRCISYIVICFGLVVYTVSYFISGGVRNPENEKYSWRRHLLQSDDVVDNDTIDVGRGEQSQKSNHRGVSVITEFINSSNGTESFQPEDDDDNNNTICQMPSIAEFPRDLFTNRQRKHGAIIVHVLVAIYMCVGLAIVCDYYFVPSLEVLCHKLKIQADVAGASLMAIGSSAPELCASVIGVFVTKGDIGIGTILGSAVFNLLFVIGVCGIFATSDLKLSWWPITRDTMCYGLTVVVLSVVIFDSTVHWQESVAMFLLYIGYLVLMSQNQRIEKKFYMFVGDTKSYQARFEKESDETTPITANDSLCKEARNDDNDNNLGSEASEMTGSDISESDEAYPDDPPENIISYPDSIIQKIGWVLTFPIKLTYFLTIPDLRRPRCRGFVILTFFMAISWIGFLTYTLVWMVTTVGFTVEIPDSVMGLTFVAFGSSVPDGLASMIVAKQGKGDMAVSQALGSNVFDILLGLGLPWTINSMIGNPVTKIQSVGMLISCFVTFVLAMLVLLAFYIRKFVLGRQLGGAMLTTYAMYLIAAVATELYLYQDYQIPMCKID